MAKTPESTAKEFKQALQKQLPALVWKHTQESLRDLANAFLEELKNRLNKSLPSLVQKLSSRSTKAQSLLSGADLTSAAKYSDFLEIKSERLGTALYLSIMVPDKVYPGTSVNMVFISRALEYGSKSMELPASGIVRKFVKEYTTNIGALTTALLEQLESRLKEWCFTREFDVKVEFL